MKKFYPRLSQLVQGFRISQISTRIAGLLLLTLILNASVFAADRFSVASGPWSSTSTWSTSTGGSPGASVPGVNDNVIIEGGYSVNLTAAASAIDISIASGSSLIASTFSITVTGNWTNNGTFSAGNSATVFFSKPSGTQTLKSGGSSFNSLQHNNLSILQLVTDDLLVNNTLTNSFGTLDPNGLNVTATVSFSLSGGAFIGGTGNLSVGNFSLSTNGTTMVAPSGNFTVSGNWIRSNTSTFTPGTNTVNFNGTVTQSINSALVPFFNVIHTGSGLLQLSSSGMVTNGTFINQAGAGNFISGASHTVAGLTTINGGNYTVAGGTQNFGGGIIINPGGSLTHSNNALNVQGNWTNNGGAFTPGANTVIFNGNIAQTIGGTSPSTFNNLTITNTASAVATLAADVTVSALLTVSANANLNLASQNLYLAAVTPILTGTFNTATSTVFYTNPGTVGIAPSNYYNLNLTGGARTNAVTIGIGNILTPGSVTTLAGTVSFNGSGNQSIPALTYTNLQTATSGTKTLAGNTTVSAVLTVGASSTIDLGAANTLTLSGSGNPLVIVGGGIFIPSSSTVVFSNNSNNLTIPSATFYNLQTTGGYTKSFTGAVTVNNIFTIGSGSTVALGANVLTLTGAGTPLVISGALTVGTSTVVYNSTAAQTVGTAYAFNNLTINNTAGVTLGANVTVKATLNFINGLANTGANILILENAATITGAGAGKYVNGNLRLGIPTGANSKVFEIGDAAAYTPVQISFTNAPTGTLTAFTTAGDHPQVASSEINPAKSVNRTWDFTSSVSGGFGAYNATFNFVSGDIDGGSNSSLFSINNYTSTTNSWAIPTIGTRLPTSTQITGTAFALPGNTIFQVGEAAAETPCAFGSNTNSGFHIQPCVVDLTSNSTGIATQYFTVSSSFSAGQYFTLDVIAGLNYRIYTANTTNPADPLMLSIFNENAPSDPALAVSFSNAGNGATQPNNVYILFTPTISGKVRVLINKKRDCGSVTPNNLIVRVHLYGGGNNLDNQMAAGNDSWTGHIYDGVTNVPFTGNFNNYLGYYTKSESFSEIFGNATADNCIGIITSGGNLNGTSFRTDNFSVRYRMNSTKKGLFVADIKSDDGTRLSVDGALVYNYKPGWLDGQGPTLRAGILMLLNGSSSLQLDYNELAGGQEVSFNNFTKVIGNDLTTGLVQANCQGNDAVKISGDTLVLPLPVGLFRDGNATGYKWYYSTTLGGTRILLPDDTHSFTPNTAIAPFNLPGTYYIFRTVSLRSTNNLNATASPFIQTIESNPAVLTVTISAPLHTVTTASSTFCYGNSATINLASSTIGVNYQLRNNANNAPIGGIIAGTGGALNFATGPLFATTTINVTAINTTNGCTVKMTNLVTFSTTPDGGKSVFSNFGLVCVGNNAKITVANADLGVRYLLRNYNDKTPVGDTLSGLGDDLELEIPVGYLIDPVTPFEVWAMDVNAGCAGVLLDTVQIATQNFSSPFFNIDQDFCSLDSGKVLLTPTNTGYASYLWSIDSTTTSIIIEQSGIYALTVTDINGCRTTKSINVGEELLLNGDFSMGRDQGYKTGYIWGPPSGSPNFFPSNPQNNGYYTIATNGRNTHVDFWGRDHTSKNGNFMIINGEASSKKVWYDTVKVEANTRYYFSAWAMSLNDKPPFSVMRFKIDGVLRGDSAILPPGVSNNSNYGWRRFYGAWDSGPTVRDASNNRIGIEIVNLVNGNAGNDFGLDDISFSKLPPVKFFAASIGNGGNSLCVGASLSLTADLKGGQNPITYDWRGPGGFTSSAANPVIPAGTAVPGWYYLKSTEGRNCKSEDSVFIIIGDPKANGVSQGAFKCQSTGITIYLTGMVPYSKNNTINYQISTVPVSNKVAVNVDADSNGVGYFFIPNPPIAPANNSYDGRTLTVTSISNGSCTKAPLTSLTTTLTVKGDNAGLWIGPLTGGNWTDPWNWCPGVPRNATNVVVPTNVTINVNAGDSAVCADITLQGTSRVKIKNGGRLMLWRDIVASSTGKIDATEGIIETKRDNANQDLPANYFVDRSISTLLISNTNNTNGKLTITNDTLRVLSALIFNNNVADLETNNLLVLASSDTATARVGIIPAGVGNVITGNFIVERYLLNARKWRLLSAPTNRTLPTVQTVRNSWQENGANGNTLPGYGFIAADTRYTASNTLGFDQKGNNGSVKKFNPTTEAWDAVANTDALTINAEQGYLVFVAGDRRITFPGSNATKFRTVGTLNRGTLTPIPVAANKFTVIGNPYASRIDLTKLTISGGIDNAIYVWDPSIGGAYGLGAFNTLFKSGGDYVNTINSSIYPGEFAVHNFIESGAAFIVKGNTGGTITFTETAKAVESQVANFAPLERKWLLAKLQLPAQGGVGAVTLDAAIADFDDSYSNEIDDNDVKKLVNTGESVGWKGIGRDIVVDRRFTPASDDTLHLKITQMNVRNYQWEMSMENMDYPGKQAFLLDKYKQTSTALSMAGSTLVDFSIENIPGSYASDRFKIVFKQQAVLPVTITSISANRNNDKTIAVQWKVENELNLKGYELERSGNGKDFTTLQTKVPEQNAGGAAVYNTVDADNQTGDLFYRIKATSLSGQVQYSAIVKVTGIVAKTAITVYPNPVTGKQMQVRFSAVEAGMYQLSLMNTAGQVIYKSALNVANGTSAKSIQLNNDVAAGSYDLLITTPEGKQHNQQIIIK